VVSEPSLPTTLAFGPWQPLDGEQVDGDVWDAPGAVQLRRADGQLVSYPRGKSAMVFYFYAARSVREALRRVFRDELAEPGARGQGPLVFRVCLGGEEARLFLERHYESFVAQFGRAPCLHVDDDADDASLP
jgi:hypothetical protein